MTFNPPSGLVPLDRDYSAMSGSGAPQLRCLLQSDPLAYGAGDVLLDVPGLRDPNGVQVAASPWSALGPRAAPAGPAFVLVAVPPGVLTAPSFATPASSASAQKSANVYVWALPALARAFEVAGDGAIPSRPGELQMTAAGYTAMPITARGVAEDGLFAELKPGVPVAGVSTLTLSGASFRTNRNSRSMVQVRGYATGNGPEVLAAGALYRVRLLEGAW